MISCDAASVFYFHIISLKEKRWLEKNRRKETEDHFKEAGIAIHLNLCPCIEFNPTNHTGEFLWYKKVQFILFCCYYFKLRKKEYGVKGKK